MECLDANAVQDLMADALEAATRTRVMTHLDTCADCRELVGVLAKDTIRESRPGAATGLEATAMPIGLEATAISGPTTGFEATALPRQVTGLEATGLADPFGATVGTGRTPKLAGISVGHVLGKLELVERLGAGAMGVVYRAEDRELGRYVAVKILHRPDDALTTRLVREARSMAQVNHPNVVAVYDVDVSDTTTYIAMELVEGTSLRGWQKAKRSIPEILEAYVAAGRGLAAAHASGIVHRDFKPDNVLVGRDGRVRVTDFGLAATRSVEDADADASASSAVLSDLALTQSGSVLGTPAYMAPEQFSGGNVDARTDQFNFSVALYEALYGERPFTGKSFEELRANVIASRQRPPPPSTRVSNALRRIVVRGMSAKPGDRYPTMDHMLDELARDRARPWRRAAIAAATVAVVLGFGLAADWSVRDRLESQIAKDFAATGKLVDRTMRIITKVNDAIASQASLFNPVVAVSAFRADSDFGLGAADDDERSLQDLHDQLASADWRFAREMTASDKLTDIAVGDYKGVLLYTSLAPQLFPKTDLRQVAWLRKAIEGGGKNMRLTRNDDPALVATKLLGAEPKAGVSVVFTHTGIGGGGLFFQILDAADVLENIELASDTMLSIVGPDDVQLGNVPFDLGHVPMVDEIREVQAGAATYQILAKPITGPDRQVVGHIVMASRLDGVLSLFPHARAVFAAAMLAALALAIATALRARHLAGGPA